MKLVVIGAQWGDEGKGKIVDYLTAQGDMAVRFSGGANAGHTIVVGDDTYKLHLIPSGIIYPHKSVILGSGMVVDPQAFLDELAMLEEKGINWQGRIFISDRAHLVLPEYRVMDREFEKDRRFPIGTTGRGIGIAYAQKANRDGIRVCDLFEDSILELLSAEDKELLIPFREKIQDMVIDIAVYMHKNRDKKIVFEGAQGVLLDLDLGTYPYVSSGVSCAAGASPGGGVGIRDIDRILGVFKAYTTRVGNGPFPSEFKAERDGDLEDQIRELGREYGVTTGRPRRCGYLDLVALRYACRTNSIDSLVLTHLDVYDGMDEIKACVAYQSGSEKITDFPASRRVLSQARPVTKSFKGWRQKVSDCQNYDDLPREAKDYIRFIEDFTETKVDIISVGYQREQTFVRKEIWTRS